MIKKYEYTLKDMNTNFYFRKDDDEDLHQYVPLDRMISKYREKWVKTVRCAWFEFLEHCSYLIFQEIHKELKLEHDFPNEFEPTLNMLVLMIVKKFDDDVLSKDGWYLVDRAGHGYDLGLLSPLCVNWVDEFYKNCSLTLSSNDF